MNLSIKKRIYLSFGILASLFVINGVIIVITLNNNQQLSKHLTEVIDPSVQSLNDFKSMLILSREFSINWVFLRSNDEYKKALKEIHINGYPDLKTKINATAEKWVNPQIKDSLSNMFVTFENTIVYERKIMTVLAKFEDYNDLEKKFGAEAILENNVIPGTNSILKTLNRVILSVLKDKIEEEKKVEKATLFMRVLIVSLIISIISLAIFLSLHMKKIIIRPIDKIIGIVDDLGKGVIKKVDDHVNEDEMGRMIKSVNHLSDNLLASTIFAYEIGNRNFSANYQPLSNEDKLGKALISMRDNLKLSDETLNQAQHIALLGNWQRDAINNKVTWSDEIYSIMETDAKAFNNVHLNFVNFIHPDERDTIKTLLSKFYDDKKPIEFECRIITPKGNTKYVALQADSVINEKGELTRVFGIIQDITKRKIIEKELIETENKYRGLFEKMLDGVYKSSNEGRFIEANPALVKMLGYDSKEDLLAIDIKSQLYFEKSDRDNAVLQDQSEGMAVYRLRKKDGSEIWVEDRGQYVSDENGNILYHEGIIRDVTKRKEQQDALEKTNYELQKSNNELDKFVYSISHDLRAPLLSMQGVVTITEEVTEEKSTVHHMQMLKGSIGRLDHFIGEILDYSRNTRHGIRREAIDFKKMLEEMLIDMENKDENKGHVKIKYEIDSCKSVFYSDNERLRTVFGNVILNSLKYYNPQAEYPYVKISIKVDENAATINIEDNGIGIDEQYHEKIFEMFYRVSERSKGSGLGLYIVKEIVEKLKGKLAVQSKTGAGSTFHVTIPNLFYQ